MALEGTPAKAGLPSLSVPAAPGTLVAAAVRQAPRCEPGRAVVAAEEQRDAAPR